MTKKEKEQWGRLCALADSFKTLAPWEWCKPGMPFAIWPDGREEPCFALFCDSPEPGTRIIRFALGYKAFFLMSTLSRSQSRPVATWMFEIPFLELLFIKGPMLSPRDHEILKALGRDAPGGDGLFAVFRSIRPGFHPWTPDADERALLEALVYQTYGMALRLEGNPAFPLRKDEGLFTLRQGEDGKWNDSWLPLPEIEDAGIEISLKAGFIQKLRRLAIKPRTFQIDFKFAPMLIDTSGSTTKARNGRTVKIPAWRPPMAFLLVAANTEADEVYYAGPVLASDGIEKMWGEMPRMLMELFEKIGGFPQTVEVTGDRMANLMRSFEVYQPFKLVLRVQLKTIDGIFERLARSLAGRKRGGAK